MLHRDNGGEPKRVETFSAGSASATGNQLKDVQAFGWLGSDDGRGLVEAICALRAGHGNLLPILLTEPQMGKAVPYGPAHISSFDCRSQIMISPPVTGMTAAVM